MADARGGRRQPSASSHAPIGARDYDGDRRWNVTAPPPCRPIASRARRPGTGPKPLCRFATRCGSFLSCSGRISHCSRSSGRCERGRSRGRSSRNLALTPGTRLGVYEVTAQIGVGGMGEVYHATDTKLKRQVAIKILPPSLAADHDRLARFQREAEVLASLNHPNIAAIYGLEESGGMTALVMELVEGPTIEDMLAPGSRLPAPGCRRNGAAWRTRAGHGAGPLSAGATVCP
ncbi:MAG: hypothetical protein EXQ59_04860 [Acidobacteria bacterium]|nr:hypothetical protein [Acidobacteriota bacterium]